MVPRRARRAAGGPPAARRRGGGSRRGPGDPAQAAFVRLVGHGSSDNAAALGTYAFGLLGGVPAFRDSISLSVYYGAEHGRADARRRPVPVRADTRRRRVRRPGARPRRADDRRDERPALRARRRSGDHRSAPRGAGAAVAATKTYVNQPPPSRCLPHLPVAARRRSRTRCGGPPGCSPRPSKPSTGPAASGPSARLRRAPVCDRARRRVRDGPRDRAEADRDPPDRRRAAHDHGPLARAGRRARRAVPGLGRRDARPVPPHGPRGDTARARLGRRADRERRRGGRGGRRRAVAAGPARLSPSSLRCCRRSCRWSRGRSRWPAGSTPIDRAGEGHAGGLNARKGRRPMARDAFFTDLLRPGRPRTPPSSGAATVAELWAVARLAST